MLMKINGTYKSLVSLLLLFIAGAIIFGTEAFSAHEPGHNPGEPPVNVNPIDNLQSQIASNDDDITTLQNQDTLLQGQIDSQNAALISAVANLQAQLDDLSSATENIADLENRISLLEQSQASNDGNIEAANERITELENTISQIIHALASNNMAPIVDAGEDKTIMLSQEAVLQGSATDDGIVEPLTLAWNMVSGPGNAIIDDSTAALIHVQFDQTGVYEFQFTADDGFFQITDNVQVEVFVDNDPPTVDAGPDFEVVGVQSTVVVGNDPDRDKLSCAAQLSALVTDDGLPNQLEMTWEAIQFNPPPDHPCWGNPIISCDIDGSAMIANPEDNPAQVEVWEIDQCGILGSLLDCEPDPVEWTFKRFKLTVTDGFHTVQDEVQITCVAP